MKPPPFEYEAPRTADEAVALLAQHGDRAKVLAGGQSLVPLLNFRLAQPEVLVDVNRVSELAYVRPVDTGLAIGALTRQHALERSSAIRVQLPIVAEACRLIGHLPIRHRGTVGGSLAHADPASELPAVMVALEAELTLSRKGSRRTVPADQFFTGIFSTALEPEELLTDIRVPGLPPRTGSAFRRDRAARRRFRARRRRSARHAQRRRSCHPRPARPVWRRSHAHPRARGGAGADRRVAGGARARRRRREDGGGDRSAERHPCLGNLPQEARASRGTPGDRAGGASRRRCVMKRSASVIGLTVNGIQHELAVEPRRLLVDCLREDLGLTGTHIGCEHGVCGTCTVLVDGETRAVVPDAGRPGRRRHHHHRRGPGAGRRAASAAAGVPRGAGAAVRVLHAGHADAGRGSCCATIPRRARPRFARRSRRTSVAARATRASSSAVQLAAERGAVAGTRPQRRAEGEGHGHDPTHLDRQGRAAPGRSAPADGARQLHRRRAAGGHGTRGGAPQPAGPCAHRPHRHEPGSRAARRLRGDHRRGCQGALQSPARLLRRAGGAVRAGGRQGPVRGRGGGGGRRDRSLHRRGRGRA